MYQQSHAWPAQSSEESDDAELLDEVRRGNLDAYAIIVERYRDAARRIAVRRAGSNDADDLVAEAFTRILDLLLRGQGPQESFVSYLAVTVRSLHLNQVRNRHRCQPTSDLELLGINEVALDATGFDGDDRALEALRQLPPRWQAVIWLTVVEQRSQAETALALGLRPNAVAALKFRAMSGLRKAYDAAEALASNCA